ncbi:TM0106 family RecB-like putative nuclease [Patescibacteria group bacterium]|nr:TM0106 family RecB-like putative nuclease [Patescibacteria group bacterium]MBU1673904.1 TM0106 family RecB-like putative nuclease [Patescibacteria group bacterium]MBU1963423.1 TM0106 family RecB-like putative nuclease [Patescibacteria group bacterium]
MKIQTKKIIFTPQLFFKYGTAPHWLWHDIYTEKKEKGEMPELMEKLLEQGVLYEEEYVKNLKFREVKETSPLPAFQHTKKLMQEGADLIYQGEIQYEEKGIIYRGRPDFLKREDGGYIAIDIKSSKDIKKEQRQQLVLYSLILEKVQGKLPATAAIINKDGIQKEVKITKSLIIKTKAQIEEILEIIRGKKPPLKLTSTYKNSPWFDKCVKDAEKENDIALIYKLDSRAHEKLRELGIKTVEQAAKMDVGSLPKIPHASRKILERAKIQAQALQDGDLKWLKNPKIPDAKLKLFFDIEGDPLLQVEYMFGFWVSGDPKMELLYEHANVVPDGKEEKYFIYFLAEKPEDEKAMWEDFIDWLETLPEDYLVYHYAPYEKIRTRKMADEYGRNDAFEKFHSRLVDLYEIVLDSVIFPLYFYSVKDIAKSKFLDFKWRHPKAGGAQSIFWYEKWLETGDKQVLQDIINYNEDDVRATEYLYKWLTSQSK